jgi:hypothetical protein
MSSPNIKFQTLIRKFKNGIKESLDKQRIINDFTYQLSSEEILLSQDIFQEKKYSDFIYDISNLTDARTDRSTSVGIPIPAASLKFLQSGTSDFYTSAFENDNQMLFSFSPNVYQDFGTEETVSRYTGDEGYLKNVYNAEYCNDEWIIMMYFINRLYANFATHDKIKIKSLHVHTLPGSKLSALHHFLNNSKINSKFQNIEWQWMGTVNNVIDDPYQLNKAFRIKYSKNLLQLFDTELCSPNNVKFIVNETLNKLGKLNFLCITAENNLKYYIAYAILTIKLLELNCICYINLPNPTEWNITTINALILYGLIFQELYLFKFKFDNILYTVLICKNKKKISVEILYKKLLSLLSSEYLESHNLFSLDYVKNTSNINKLLDIINKSDNVSPIILSDIIYEINKVLDMNINTFL